MAFPLHFSKNSKQMNSSQHKTQLLAEERGDYIKHYETPGQISDTGDGIFYLNANLVNCVLFLPG